MKTLVAIPSVNPEDDDPPEAKGEKRYGDFLADWLDRRGFSVEVLEQLPDRNNVIGTYGPENPERTILIEAHLDTVSVKGMTRPPFEPTIENGRLYGRGACDVKGPAAAAMHALDAGVLSRLADQGIGLTYIGAIGEEKGNLGADWLVDTRGIGADMAIVLEPTELKIVHAHKGIVWGQIELIGKPGHGSDPEAGINAIGAMGWLIPRLEAMIEEDQGRLNNPALGKPSLNIGRIRGGSAVNIVAPHCLIDIDRRYLPEENAEAIKQGMEKLCAEAKSKGLIVDYTVTVKKNVLPFETATDSELVGRFQQACKAEGEAGELAGTGWFSDGGPFARTSGEVIVFGPGSIKQAHTRDEYIELESLQKGADIFQRFLNDLVGP
ncbi:MAG: M20 family metallopeptidase [Verrucomicrobiota bacterium]